MNWDEGEAKAEVEGAIAGAAAAPERRTAVPSVVPTAATVHAERAIGITIGSKEFCTGIVGS